MTGDVQAKRRDVDAKRRDMDAKRHGDSDGERDNCLSPDGDDHDLSDFAVTHWRKLLSRRSVEQFEVVSQTHAKSSENYAFEVGPCGRRPNLVIRRVVTHGLPPSFMKAASQWRERRRNMSRRLKQHVSTMPHRTRRLLSDRFTEICCGTVKRNETDVDVAPSRAVLSETGNVPVPMRDRLKASLTQNNALLSQLPRSCCVTGLDHQGALMETEQRETAMVPADASSDGSVSNAATDDAFGPSPRKKKKMVQDVGEMEETNVEAGVWQSRPVEGDSLKVSFKRISSPSSKAEKSPVSCSPDRPLAHGRSDNEHSHGEDEIFRIPTVVSRRVAASDDRYGCRDREDVTMVPSPRNLSPVTVKQCLVDLCPCVTGGCGCPSVTGGCVKASDGKLNHDGTPIDTCARRDSITGTGSDCYANVKHVVTTPAKGIDVCEVNKNVGKLHENGADICTTICHVNDATTVRTAIRVGHITPAKHSDIQVKRVAKASAKHDDSLVKRVAKASTKHDDIQVKLVAKASAKHDDILVKRVAKTSAKHDDILVKLVAKASAKHDEIKVKRVAKASAKHDDIQVKLVAMATAKHDEIKVKRVAKATTKHDDIQVKLVAKATTKHDDIQVKRVAKATAKHDDIQVKHVAKASTVKHISKSSSKHVDPRIKHVTKSKSKTGDIHSDVKRATKPSTVVSPVCVGVHRDSKSSTTVTDFHANIRDATMVPPMCSDILAGHVTKPPTTSGHPQSGMGHVSKSSAAGSDVYAGSRGEGRTGIACIAEAPATSSPSLKRIIEVCSAGIGHVTKAQTTRRDTKGASLDTFDRVNKVAALMTPESYLRVAQALSTAEETKTSRRRKTPDGSSKKSSRSSVSPHGHSETSSKSSHRKSAPGGGVMERTRSTSGKHRTAKRKSSGESGVKHGDGKSEKANVARPSSGNRRKSCESAGIGGATNVWRDEEKLGLVRDNKVEAVFSTSDEQPAFRHAEELSSAKVHDKDVFSTVEQPAFMDGDRLGFAKVHDKAGAIVRDTYTEPLFSTSEQPAFRHADKLSFAKVHSDKADAVVRDTYTEPLFSTSEQPAFRDAEKLGFAKVHDKAGADVQNAITVEQPAFRDIEKSNIAKVHDKVGAVARDTNTEPLFSTVEQPAFSVDTQPRVCASLSTFDAPKTVGSTQKVCVVAENERKVPDTKWKSFGKEVELPENETKVPDTKSKVFGNEMELLKNEVEVVTTLSEGFWEELKSYTQRKLHEEVKVSQEEGKKPRADVTLPVICVVPPEMKLSGGEVKIQDSEVKVHDSEVKVHDAEVKVHDSEVIVQDAEIKACDVEVKVQEAAMSPCNGRSAAFYTDICQPDFTTTDNASLPRVSDNPSIMPSPQPHDAGLARKDGLMDVFANTSHYALQKQKLSHKDQSTEHKADLAPGFRVPPALVARVVEACGVNLPTVSQSKSGAQTTKRMENKPAVSQSEGTSERRPEIARQKTHPTKSSSAGKFHGRTLLSGAEVPVRMIPYKPLYLFHPIRQSGKLQEIPIDPRTAHYARRQNRLSSEKLTNLLDSLCSPESCGSSSASNDDQWHKSNVCRLWNAYSATDDDTGSAMSLMDARKTEMRHGVASGNMEAESPHCGAHGAGVVVSRWGQRTKQPKPPRNGFGATSGRTNADSGRF